jgi:hypothetical protein
LGRMWMSMVCPLTVVLSEGYESCEESAEEDEEGKSMVNDAVPRRFSTVPMMAAQDKPASNV